MTDKRRIDDVVLSDEQKAAVAGLAETNVYLTKAPDPVLAFEGINMSRYSDQLDSLGADFAKSEGITDDRLVSMDSSIFLSDTASGSGQDGSARLLAMVSSGQINMIAADAKSFAAVNRRGDITKPAEVMDAAELERIKGSLVDAKGKPSASTCRSRPPGPRRRGYPTMGSSSVSATSPRTRTCRSNSSHTCASIRHARTICTMYRLS